MTTTSLPSALLGDTAARLKAVNAPIAKRFTGESGARQPVHTVYGGAQLFKKDAAAKLGKSALKSLEDYGPDPKTFARAVGIPEQLADVVYERVRGKLHKEPVEDLRIDFEDGYGNRPDAEEDKDAARCAHEVAAGMKEKTLPPFIGIRIKTFSDELFPRSVRTLDLFVSALVTASGGKLPDGFVVTLPKITAPEQVGILADLLEALEQKLNLDAGALRLEVMIEDTRSILALDGTIALPKILDNARGRCVAAHFGTYDYTASNNITAAHQSMEHLACDFAKSVSARRSGIATACPLS